MECVKNWLFVQIRNSLFFFGLGGEMREEWGIFLFFFFFFVVDYLISFNSMPDLKPARLALKSEGHIRSQMSVMRATPNSAH